MKQYLHFIDNNDSTNYSINKETYTVNIYYVPGVLSLSKFQIFSYLILRMTL